MHKSGYFTISNISSYRNTYIFVRFSAGSDGCSTLEKAVQITSIKVSASGLFQLIQ